MFQFTSTTVINSENWTAKDGVVRIKGGQNFKKENVLEVIKTEGYVGENAKATLDLKDLKEGNYRLAMYIRLSGNANSYYANDLVFQGKPLYIEFISKGESGEELANKVVSIAKKHMLTVYEKDIVKVTAEGSVLTIEATDEYQRFQKVELEEYKKEVPFSAYESILSATIEKAGKEGFGTYQYILKNLRLPSAVRGTLGAVAADEAPVIGALYDEYVIRYCANRGILGTDAVGEVTKSLTTHVFFVNSAISSKFETAMAELKASEEIEETTEL